MNTRRDFIKNTSIFITGSVFPYNNINDNKNSKIENISNNFIRRLLKHNNILKNFKRNNSFKISILSTDNIDFYDIKTTNNLIKPIQWFNKTIYDSIFKNSTTTKTLSILIDNCLLTNFNFQYYCTRDNDITSDLITSIYHKMMQNLYLNSTNNNFLNIWETKWYKTNNSSNIGFSIIRLNENIDTFKV